VKRSSASLPPLGRVEVEGRLHAGRSFDVWAVRHEDRDLCVKTPGCATSRGFRSDATGFETSLWGGSTGEIAEAGDLVDPGVLLTLEAERIRATGGAWNHDVVGLGYWHPDPPRGRDESAPRWLPALVMPHHPGATLASFPPEQQRRLVVGMMPALWDALVAARHGDLSAENVLVDLERGRFVLIDPGVCLWSLTSSGADDQYDWMDHRVAFTTTPASYPLLPPTYEAPGEGLEGLGLDAHLRVLGRLGGSFMVGPIIGTAWFRPGDREIERAIVRKTLELEGPPDQRTRARRRPTCSPSGSSASGLSRGGIPGPASPSGRSGSAPSGRGRGIRGSPSRRPRFSRRASRLPTAPPRPRRTSAGRSSASRSATGSTSSRSRGARGPERARNRAAGNAHESPDGCR
jgi:hypothetical protein